MIAFVPVILICNSLLPVTECKEGGRDVDIWFAEMQLTPMMCIQEGNARAAKLAVAPQADSNFYIKIKCQPREVASITVPDTVIERK